MRYLTEYSFVTTILVIPTNTDFPKQRVTEGGQPIVTKNDGVVRGLIGEGTSIPEGMKVGDYQVDIRARGVMGILLYCI